MFTAHQLSREPTNMQQQSVSDIFADSTSDHLPLAAVFELAGKKFTITTFNQLHRDYVKYASGKAEDGTVLDWWRAEDQQGIQDLKMCDPALQDARQVANWEFIIHSARKGIVCIQEVDDALRNKILCERPIDIGVLIEPHGEHDKNEIAIMYDHTRFRPRYDLEYRRFASQDNWAMFVTFDLIDGDSVIVCNAHMAWNLGDYFKKEILPHVQSLGDHPVIVCGDYNVCSLPPALKDGRYIMDYLPDVYPEENILFVRALDGITHPNCLQNVQHASQQLQQFDHIMVVDDLRLTFVKRDDSLVGF